MDYFKLMLFTLPLVVDKNDNQQIVIVSIFQDKIKKEMCTETKENESAFYGNIHRQQVTYKYRFRTTVKGFTGVN